MIDGGQLLMLFGILLLYITPARQALAVRKGERSMATSVLSRAFPPPAGEQSLDDLAARADAALQADDLARGVAETASTYDRA